MPSALTLVRFDILTLFPDMFPPVLATSILGRAAEGGLVSYHVHDIRRWSDNKHRRVDDRPFGGGPGMVMMCQPLFDAVLAVEALDPTPAQRVLLTPQGKRLEQPIVEDLARLDRLLLIAGHYEGIDERVIEELAPLEISIGDFVVSGGELPALILIDAMVRLQAGALGHEASAAEDSFAPRPVPTTSKDARGKTIKGQIERRLLDCPHYTRPQVWNGRAVPEVLLSGDHQAVEQWRTQQMIQRTQQRRPELWKD